MNTTNSRFRSVVRWGLALAVASLLGVPVSSSAQPKGGEVLLRSTPIKTPADVANVEAGDMIAMSCPKCKTITITAIQKEKGDATRTVGTERHLCPGCKTEMKVKGHGKNAKAEYTHVCGTCGSKDAFCCVMKKGGTATKGMEAK